MTSPGGVSPFVTVERPFDGVGVVTLNRPAKRNALSPGLSTAIGSAVVALDSDPEIKVIVLTGAGPAFCAGHELEDIAEASATLVAADRLTKLQHEVASLTAVRTVLTPVIAAVNGAARGGGMALAVACDFRVAAQSATFGTTFARLGYSAGEVGLSWTLPRLVGSGVALKLMLADETFGATEAHRIGLVEDVVPDEELLEETFRLAKRIASYDRHALRMSKDAVNRSAVLPFAEAVDYECITSLTTFTVVPDPEPANN